MSRKLSIQFLTTLAGFVLLLTARSGWAFSTADLSGTWRFCEIYTDGRVRFGDLEMTGNGRLTGGVQVNYTGTGDEERVAGGVSLGCVLSAMEATGRTPGRNEERGE